MISYPMLATTKVPTEGIVVLETGLKLTIIGKIPPWDLKPLEKILLHNISWIVWPERWKFGMWGVEAERWLDGLVDTLLELSKMINCAGQRGVKTWRDVSSRNFWEENDAPINKGTVPSVRTQKSRASGVSYLLSVPNICNIVKFPPGIYSIFSATSHQLLEGNRPASWPPWPAEFSAWRAGSSRSFINIYRSTADTRK